MPFTMATCHPHCLVSPALGPAKPLRPEGPCSGRPAWHAPPWSPPATRGVPGACGPASTPPPPPGCLTWRPSPGTAQPPQTLRAHVCARLLAGALRLPHPTPAETHRGRRASMGRDARPEPGALCPHSPAAPGTWLAPRRGRGNEEEDERSCFGAGGLSRRPVRGSEDVRSGRGRSPAGGPAPCSSGAPWRRPRRGDG